jgi:hypothetical protein
MSKVNMLYHLGINRGLELGRIYIFLQQVQKERHSKCILYLNTNSSGSVKLSIIGMIQQYKHNQQCIKCKRNSEMSYRLNINGQSMLKYMPDNSIHRCKNY